MIWGGGNKQKNNCKFIKMDPFELSFFSEMFGARGSVAVKALYYTPESRGFETGCVE
jgi:hypothetical protein